MTQIEIIATRGLIRDFKYKIKCNFVLIFTNFNIIYNIRSMYCFISTHITTTVTIECDFELPFVGDSLLQPSSSFKKLKVIKK